MLMIFNLVRIISTWTDNPEWTHSFDPATHILTLNTLNLSIQERVYIKIPVIWILPYSGPRHTDGSVPAGTGGTGTCTGDITNSVTITTTISDDIDLTDSQSCEPTNVYCLEVNANAGQIKC